ncbi:MAG: hypothetical protein J0H34_22445 [Rhizobiales bacterium]|nr:hypothetical protein [Hyphomicrobiales bacterium]
MTDEQFRELRQLLLDLQVRVSELEMHLKRQDEIASHRQSLIFEWCAPLKYKNAMLTTEIDIPDDLRKFFPDQN